MERSNGMEAICKADYDIRAKANKAAEEAVKQAKDAGRSTSRIIVPEIGYYDIYGVWFFGNLKEIIIQIGNERFDVDLGKMMHVYVDVEPKSISDGIHDIAVYGQPSRLYKWMAQGYHRGLVVLVDDEVVNRDAEMYRLSGTWSWVMVNEKISLDKS
jgi:hypothetical protein